LGWWLIVIQFFCAMRQGTIFVEICSQRSVSVLNYYE
jgi:hypothetical protein